MQLRKIYQVCANTTAKGGKPCHRLVNVEATGGPWLARLIEKKKNLWVAQRPIFAPKEDSDEEQQEVRAEAKESAPASPAPDPTPSRAKRAASRPSAAASEPEKDSRKSKKPKSK